MDFSLRKHALPTYFRRFSEGEREEAFVFSDYTVLGHPITALHYHDTMEIGIVLSGEGEVHIDDRVYRYHPGCIQIVRRFQPHLATSDDGKTSRWIWVAFDAQRLLAEAGVTNPQSVRALLSDSAALSGMFEENEHPALTAAVQSVLKEAKESDAYSPLALAFAVGELLILLSRLCRDKQPSHDVSDPDMMHILPAIEEIAGHLGDNERLKEERLAALCRMSVSNLRRLFHLCAGCSPKSYIIRSRMAYAEHLLRRESLSVLEIALSVGYDQISCFNRTFMRHFGMSPGKYRRMTKEQ